MTPPRDLLPPSPPVLLPEDGASALLGAGEVPRTVAARYPASSAAWAVLAEEALAGGDPVAGYAYARTGYHRGLDALRRNGWKGFGPVPWSHRPNRGFLRALAALARAAGEISESDEEDRCRHFLAECDPAAVSELLG